MVGRPWVTFVSSDERKMPTQLMGVSAGEDLLKCLVVCEFSSLVCFSAYCAFPGEAMAVVCLFSPVQLVVVLVKV